MSEPSIAPPMDWSTADLCRLEHQVCPIDDIVAARVVQRSRVEYLIRWSCGDGQRRPKQWFHTWTQSQYIVDPEIEHLLKRYPPQDINQSVINDIMSSTSTPNGHHFTNGCIELTAGAIGATVNVMVGHPLDTMKVKMQAFPHLYKNSFNCFQQIVVKEGFVKGLYVGVRPALIGDILEKSVLFFAYDVCQQWVSYFRGSDQLTTFDKALSGFYASFFSCMACSPPELIKVKLQALRETGVNTNISSVQMTRQILREEGIVGLYRGLTLTLIREMPGYFFYFGGYELAKQMMSSNAPPSQSQELGFAKTTIAGGIGGVCFWTSMFPFDVIKSRVQIGSGAVPKMASVFVDIVRTEGFRGLYSGLWPTLLRAFPTHAALFLAYEYSKQTLTTIANKTFDVIFIIDGQRVPALRDVLRLKSDVFRAMFSGEFTESQQKEIRIEDITVSAFKTMIQFLYTDRLVLADERDFGLIGDALQCADKYRALRLMDAIGQHLSAAMTVQNVESVAKMAFGYQMDSLIDSVKEMFDKHFDQILRKEQKVLNKLNDTTNNLWLEVMTKNLLRTQEYSGNNRVVVKRRRINDYFDFFSNDY
ncbi:unnamed protein product [Medioppia subpectinata]|uniref:BTB domain-containing protein n=1 Tax=Medioppia subpectinata TaxID=1979941 RepID=A0A7R9KEX0_9ACAR|nr:unnamed protein product [Medioppia subpectinata]CAG2102281.1 unnamed protein product [Medioppia subpectinata]